MTKSNIIKLSIVFLLFILTSCNYQKKDGEYFFTKNDSLFSYIYNNGIRKELYSYSKDTILHGFFEGYYNYGKLRYKGFYSYGKQNGKCISYYQNGNIEYIENWKDGLVRDEFYYYYKNGNIKQYSFFDLSGKVRYIRKYNINGAVISELGHPYIQKQFMTPLDIYEGDSLCIDIYVANPPNTKSDVYYNYNNEVRRVKKLKEKPYLFREKEIYSDLSYLDQNYCVAWDFEVKFIDLITKKEKIYHDTVFYTLNAPMFDTLNKNID